MADYTQNPQGSDLQAYLTAAGVWSASLSGLVDGYVAEALQRFEQLTGRRPFLADEEESTLYFNAPGDSSASYNYTSRGGEKRVELDVPFLTVSAVTAGGTSYYPQGTAIDVGNGVYLKPDHHAVKGLPVEWLEFSFPVWGVADSVGVTGRVGSYESWPADAYNAVLAGAAAAALSDVVGLSVTGGASSWKEGDITESFGGKDGGGFQGYADVWGGRFDAAARRYRLVRVGL